MDEFENLNREIRAWSSSHKESLVNKARWSWWLAFAPVALVGLTYFVATVSLPDWFTGIRSLPTWLFWTIMVSAATVSAALTLTINCALGIRQASSSHRSVSISDSLSCVWKQIDGRWLVAALILAAIVPGWLATSPGLSYRRRVAIQLLALAPMLILLVWAAPARLKRNGLGKRWINTGMWAIEILISVSGMVLLLTLIHDFSNLFGREYLSQLINYVWPGYGQLDSLFYGALVLFPLLVIMSRIRRRFTFAWQDAEATDATSVLPSGDGQTQQADSPGFFAAIGALVKRLFGSGDNDASAQASESMARQLDRIRGELVELKLPGEVSAFATASPFGFLLQGRMPTVDQHDAIQKFLASVTATRQPQDYFGSTTQAADLLFHGGCLSGKTSALAACALLSTLLNGRNVLVITKRSGQFGRLAPCLNSALKYLQLDGAVLINRLETANRIAVRETPPQILLCSPTHYDSLLLNDVQLSQSYPTLVIDDFEQFSEIERSHLPFLADRHRWLIESQFRHFQIILACSRLSSAAERYIANRFFTSASDLPSHSVRLRSLPVADIRVFITTASNSIASIETSLLSAGVDAEEILRISADPNKTNNPLNVVFISDIQQLEKPPTDNRYSWVLADCSLTERELRYLQQRYCQPGASLVCLALTPDTDILPVVAGRDASAFRARHFQALAHVLPLRSPVPVEVARRFGIDPGRLPVSSSESQSMGAVLFWDHAGFRNRNDSDFYKFAGLVRQTSNHEPLRIDCVPNPAFSLSVTRDQSEIGLRQSDSASDWETEITHRTAEWVDNTNHPVGIFSDLAHERDFLHEKNGRQFSPTGIARVGHRIVITSTTTNDWATCKRFPVYSIDTSAGPAAAKFSGIVRAPAAGETPFLFFDLDSGQAPVPARCRLAALFDSREERIEFSEIQFTLHVNYSVMVYQPVGNPTPEQVWDIMPHGSLTSDSRFSLAASLAFAAVAQRYLPGLLAFGFPLGFSIDPAIGKLVFLIVQPATGGGTASEALRAVLNDPSLRRALLAEFLEALRQTKRGLPSLPVRAKCNYDSSLGKDSIAKAAVLLKQLETSQSIRQRHA